MKRRAISFVGVIWILSSVLLGVENTKSADDEEEEDVVIAPPRPDFPAGTDPSLLLDFGNPATAPEAILNNLAKPDTENREPASKPPDATPEKKEEAKPEEKKETASVESQKPVEVATESSTPTATTEAAPPQLEVTATPPVVSPEPDKTPAPDEMPKEVVATKTEAPPVAVAPALPASPTIEKKVPVSLDKPAMALLPGANSPAMAPPPVDGSMLTVAVPEVSIILNGKQFVPASLRLKSGYKTKLFITSVGKRPSAIVIERLSVQRWVAQHDSLFSNVEARERSKLEGDPINREINSSKITEILLDPKPGTYSFHDPLSGAKGEIIVE